MQLKLWNRSVQSVQSMHVCTWGHMLTMGLQVHQKVTTDIEQIETELVSCLDGRWMAP